mmetsp:Transcript_26488/g.41995  ORF Transcript_26488/g.41995 Transcript_26488/m.41995 type:complete len:349 (-) Transcript_26488:67-1113(-)
MAATRTFIALLSLFVFAESNLQCIDNNGKTVDWWFAYKSNHGTNYSYFDASSTETKLTPSTTQTLTAGSNSCLERTLNQVFKNKKSVNYIGYNDENPNGTTSFTLGHSKGALAFDDTSNFQGGFWLIQSVPKFPDFSQSDYEFASNGIEYGQNFLCISVNSVAQINAISNQLRYISPYVLTSNNVNANNQAIGNFSAVIQSQWLKGVSIVNITSSQGKAFTHLTRSGDQNKDMQEDVISALYYKYGFLWETWPNESSFESSYCTPAYKYDEENIQKVTLGNGWYIYNDDDHSKLGISKSSDSKSVVCSGDLNRATSQNSRGGGYACFDEPSLWNAINNIITEVDACKQ